MQQKLILLLSLFFIINDIISQPAPPKVIDEQPEQVILITGNLAKIPEQQRNDLLTTIKQHYEKYDKKAFTVFLGNNFDLNKDKNLSAEERKRQEKAAVEPYELFKKYDDEVAFVPGSLEWLNNRSEGWDNVQYVENVVERFIEENAFVPNIGCPQPYEFELEGDVLLLVLNTPWYFHQWEKPELRTYECETGGNQKFFRMLDRLLEVNQHKKVIVAGYHSVYSDQKKIGNPGKGYYRYKEFQRDLDEVLQKYNNIIYVAGNEKGQQYFEKEGNHFITTSALHSNSKNTGNDKTYVSGNTGIARITIFKDGTVNLDFINEGNIAYQKRLYQKAPLPDAEELESTLSDPTDYSDVSVVTPASTKYKAGPLKRLFLGNHYRYEWRQPIEVKVLDINNRHGGLIPIQQGGGQQTKSLRFKAGNDYIYNARSIDKDPSKVLPDQLQNTFARSIVQDQISTAHPYGLMAIPPLADAAGIYYTKPELIYIPNSPKLHRFRDEFGNMLASLELRPDEDLSEFQRFGNSKNLVSTRTMMEDVEEDNDNEVDERLFLRSRLFDMWVGDWDRHEDQWRWAEIEKEEKGTLFQPVPRDRDQVFVKFDGILPYLATRRWAVQNLENFGYNYSDIASLMYSGTYLDRRFLTELKREDWNAIADSMKNALTDEVILEGVNRLPQGANTKNNKDIIRKLKNRRDHLDEAAMKYYEVLAKEVDIVGSDKHERYELERMANGNLNVKMYKTDKEGEIKKLLYERTFYPKETNEIRLYALEGNDSFYITGDGPANILIRAFGGGGEDLISNTSRKRNVRYYDFTDYKLEGGNIKTEIYKEPRPNEYERDLKPMKYDYVAPAAFFGYNRDDGIFIGGGVNIKTFGFRKDPFAASHLIVGNYAFLTKAFNIKYEGIFTEAVGKWDLLLNLNGNFPNFVGNFFGYGNETENLLATDENTDSEFYWARYDLFNVAPALAKRFDAKHTFSIGPFYEFAKLEDTSANRFINNPALNKLDPDQLYERNHYAGLIANYTFDTRDNSMRTYEGTFFNMGGSYNYDISGNERNFTNLFGNLSFYLTGYVPFKTTLAVRVGGATNFGDFNFYQANYIGGTENLRGYRKDRFAGRTSFYQNTDIRIRLFNFGTYLLSGDVGILGFNDFGRVWIDDEDSDTLHHGYGGGIWLAPYNVAVISASYGISKEESLIYIKFGFLF